MHNLISIDGSQGEGGGQIVRSSLALSAITGAAVEICRIRAGRPKPGLARQHLTSARAVARVCNGQLEGAELGSQRLLLRPGPVTGGHYEFQVGSAGSAMLVLQTVLPVLLQADQPSVVQLEGGTHNPMAPPFDFLQHAFLPLLNRMGPTVSVELHRAGFYPAGGGQVTMRVQPQPLSGFDLLQRGKRVHRQITAVVANLPGNIARRELDVARRKLSWTEAECRQRTVESAGPGNVVWAEMAYEHTTAVFTAFGEKGVPAEQVVKRLVRSIRRWMKHDAPVGPFLADQLMLPLALSAHQNNGGVAGGRFRTTELTQHSWTHRDILQTFLNVAIDVEGDQQQCEVSIRPTG